MINPIKNWREQKIIIRKIGKIGTIISWTVIRVPVIYPVVLVKLEDGEKIIVQMVDYDSSDLKIGKKVVTIVRRTCNVDQESIIPYGIKVKPCYN